MSSVRSFGPSTETHPCGERYRFAISARDTKRYQLAKTARRHPPSDSTNGKDLQDKDHQGDAMQVHPRLGQWVGRRWLNAIPTAEAVRLVCETLSVPATPLNPRSPRHQARAMQVLRYMERVGVLTVEPGTVRLVDPTWRTKSGLVRTKDDIGWLRRQADLLANIRKAKEREKDRSDGICGTHAVELAIKRNLLLQKRGCSADAFKPRVSAHPRGSPAAVTAYVCRGLPKKAAPDIFPPSASRVDRSSAVAPGLRCKRQTAGGSRSRVEPVAALAPSATPPLFAQHPKEVLGKQTFALKALHPKATPSPVPVQHPARVHSAKQALPPCPAPTPPTPAAAVPARGCAAAALQGPPGHVGDPNTPAPSIAPAGLSLEARLAWLDAHAKHLDRVDPPVWAEPEPPPPPEPEPPQVVTPRHGQRPTVPVVQGQRATAAELAQVLAQFPELKDLNRAPVLALGASANQMVAAAHNARAHRGPARNPCGLFVHALVRIRSQAWGVRVERLP